MYTIKVFLRKKYITNLKVHLLLMMCVNFLGKISDMKCDDMLLYLIFP